MYQQGMVCKHISNINKVGDVTTTVRDRCKSFTLHPIQKSWLTAEVCALLKVNTAFKAGSEAELEAVKATLSRAIRKAKRTREQKIHYQFCETGDTVDVAGHH